MYNIIRNVNIIHIGCIRMFYHTDGGCFYRLSCIDDRGAERKSH